MNWQHHTQAHMLERYSFLWSEVRLLIAALALFIGGYPPLLYYNPFGWATGLLVAILSLAWIISGVSSVYLLYRWYTSGQRVFGAKNNLDLAAFGVSVVSGINLGLVGIIRQNIGMSISSNKGVFIIVALLYIASAYHLYGRWLKHGRKLF